MGLTCFADSLLGGAVMATYSLLHCNKCNSNLWFKKKKKKASINS